MRLGVIVSAPAVDRTHIVPALTVGAIHRPKEVLARAGGKGFNVAHVAHALGATVIAAAPLAGLSGRWVAAAAGDAGILVRPTWIPGELRTCLSVFAEGDGTLTEFYEPPPPVTPEDWDRFVRDALVALAAAGPLDAVAVSGKLPPGPPDDGLGRLVAGVRSLGYRVALDADGRGLPAALEAGPDLLKLNAPEAAALLGHPVDRGTGVAAAQELRRRGAASAVVTLGAHGAVAVGETGPALAVEAPVVGGSFPVGSGDAFLAGLLVGAAEGGSLEGRLRLAAAVAAVNTEQPGAGVVDADRARMLAAAVAVRPA